MGLKKAIRTLQVEAPFLLDLKFSVYRTVGAALRRPFEEDFRALPLLRAPQGAEFLDIGANRGQSIDAIHMMCPHVHVRAFEPNAILFERLQSRFAQRDWLRLDNIGLGDADMDATLYVPFYKQWMFDGLASFNKEEASGWLEHRMYFYADRHLRVQESLCQVRRLDDLGTRPFFVKIDVQGFELQVLRGGRETLAAHRPALLIETPDEAIAQFLRELGYEPCAYENNRFRRGTMGRLNTFFIHQQSMSTLGDHVVSP